MPMMKRDYEIVMNCILFRRFNSQSSSCQDEIEILARDLAQTFKFENSRFDEGRFLRGCGIKAAKTLPMVGMVGMSGFLQKEDQAHTLDQSNEDGLEYQRLNSPQSL